MIKIEGDNIKVVGTGGELFNESLYIINEIIKKMIKAGMTKDDAFSLYIDTIRKISKEETK